MNHEQRPCAVLRGFAIKRVERVQGAGWTIDPPSGPRWVAFEGTPAGQLVEALTALDVTAPFAESVTLPDEARACLEALLGHHDAIVDALCAKRNAASRNSDDVSLDYWNKKISAARQMKRQAERALVATQGVDAAAAVAGDAGEADALKIDVAIQAALAGNHDLFVHEVAGARPCGQRVSGRGRWEGRRMMGSLINLPGVAGNGQIDDVSFCRSPAHAIRLLRDHRAVTDAGDHGAISVYRADDGRWNCLFSKLRIDIHHSVFDTKKEVRTWLNKWYPAINGAAVKGDGADPGPTVHRDGGAS
ncbi:hypothetical protein [Burkholderia glumae]|uniref:hypothetical protein n=1 Tax=Burkholderia glumae TaxID=337 RepID=UPI002151B6AA|nr:hypothetical protein [Burkholderia glumae]